MEFYSTFLLTSLVVILLIATSIVVLVIGTKRNWKRSYRAISLIPIVAAGFILYHSFRTPDSFYKKEYEIITGITFPKSGEIVCGTNDPWFSFNGDHTSAFLVELTRKDFRMLKNHVKKRGFKPGFNTISDQLDYIESKLGTRTYDDQFVLEESSETYMIGFLDDHKSVVLVLIDF